MADPLLGPLQDNGGPTPTHALLDGSPAIDAGGCPFVEVEPRHVDQRGFRRGPFCDLGAFERGAALGRPTAPWDLDNRIAPDLVWRAPATGRLIFWSMNVADIVTAADLPAVTDPRWGILGSGDFNGDGFADLLWRRDSGQMAVWLMRYWTVWDGGYLPILEDRSRRLAGMGDFDADGRADILWRKDNGELLLWLVDGTALKAAVRLPYPRVPGWQILGVGDVDGDLRVDVLWRHDGTGTNAIWLMNGATIVSGHYLPSMSDRGWRFLAFADWDSDGRADVLWRTAVGGHIAIWRLVGTDVVAVRESPSPPPNGTQWDVIRTLNIDGHASNLLVRHRTTGQLATWRFAPDGGNGYSLLFSTQPDPGWELQGIGLGFDHLDQSATQ